eukprot:COSAG02_NODE_2581_length_8490_cov_31.587534_4_plen_107_part_00
MAAKLQQSTTDFHKMQCMWTNGLIKRRMKFRMLRRFQQQMMFGGAVSWMLETNVAIDVVMQQAQRDSANSWVWTIYHDGGATKGKDRKPPCSLGRRERLEPKLHLS